MPDPANTRLVLNSYILNDIAAVIMTEQQEDTGEESTPLEEATAKELLQSIRERHHVICITDSLLRREYEQGSRSYGMTLLLPALQDLESDGVVKRPHTSTVPNLTGITQRHRLFSQEAIRTNSQYFLTRRQQWLNLREDIEREHGLIVLTPEEYIDRQKS